MNASPFDRARAERFAQLLDEAEGARRHHARCRLDEELVEPVVIGRKLHSMRFNVAATPEFKADLRTQLIATAQREGIGETAIAPQRVARTIRSRILATRPRARGAIVVGIAAGTLALSGVSVASGEAVPGDTLYGMKRSTERAQLALAGSDVSRGQLYLDFARTRLQEAYAVRSSEARFIGSLRDMDSDTRQGIRMLVTGAFEQRDTSGLEAVDRFIADQRMQVAKLLETGAPGGQSKVIESLALLNKAGERATAARAALACGAATIGNDGLGPVPGACAPHKQQPAPNTGGQAGGTPEGPGAASGAPQDPLASASAAAAAPEPEKKESSLLEELGRILGGLLG